MAKGYSQRSPGSQHRIDRQIQREGLNRQRALKELRGGKWTPFSRNKDKRTPEYKQNISKEVKEYINKPPADRKGNNRPVDKSSEWWNDYRKQMGYS